MPSLSWLPSPTYFWVWVALTTSRLPLPLPRPRPSLVLSLGDAAGSGFMLCVTRPKQGLRSLVMSDLMKPVSAARAEGLCSAGSWPPRRRSASEVGGILSSFRMQSK